MPIGVKQLKGHGDPGRVFRYNVRKTKVILPSYSWRTDCGPCDYATVLEPL